MKLLFSGEQFFDVFAQYNQAVWPAQILLNLIAVAAIVLLRFGGRSKDRVISSIVAFLWAWMAIAYHFAFFTRINPAAWLFGAAFIAGAFGFVWAGVIHNGVRFHAGRGIQASIGSILIGFALVCYPILSFALGRKYPAVPTFGLPCPTTIFTLGVLLFLTRPAPRSVFFVPLVWSAVGSVAAFELGVFEDLGLLAAGVIGCIAVVFDRRTGGQHSG